MVQTAGRGDNQRGEAFLFIITAKPGEGKKIYQSHTLARQLYRQKICIRCLKRPERSGQVASVPRAIGLPVIVVLPFQQLAAKGPFLGERLARGSCRVRGHPRRLQARPHPRTINNGAQIVSYGRIGTAKLLGRARVELLGVRFGQKDQ